MYNFPITLAIGIMSTSGFNIGSNSTVTPMLDEDGRWKVAGYFIG
ncbi:MAG: hypothetical protein AB4206_12840 [Xenococcaceae cyanobacterium]